MSFPLLPVCLALALVGFSAVAQPQPEAEAEHASPPVRVVVVGATHAHVGWILGRDRDAGDIEVVGVYEPNTEYAKRLLARHRIDPELHYTDLEKMLEETKPQAACLFGSIFDHRDHTIACAGHGVHVMVEKPLAVNSEHARAMAEATQKAGVHLLTNYETTWYPANRKLYELATQKQRLGELRRIVVQTGHEGPVEIGCGPEFLAWLTDPVLNGGGALTDFGCYGVNLTTWLMQNQKPVAVTAVTQQIKPDKYPKVDDEATIVIEYPGAVAVIQASWNWTMSRKDMSVYGTEGYAETVGRDWLRVGMGGQWAGETVRQPALDPPEDDPFAYLAAVVRGEIEPEGLSSLANNLIVVEVLDAARRSAESGERVELPD